MAFCVQFSHLLLNGFDLIINSVKMSKMCLTNFLIIVQVYKATGVTAVDHVNVAIPKSECFGLLGVNGKVY